MAASAIAECKLDTKVIQVTNVAPGALKEQMKTLFSFLGRIEEVRMYPSEDSESQVSARVCYVRFEDASSVGVALHLTNTVFIDRALIVVPVMDGKIPDETTALQLAPSAIAGMIPGQPTWPSNVVSQMTGQGSGLVITTYDPRLTALGLAQYPPLPGTTDPGKIEEIRRTVYVCNVDKSVSAEQLMAFFSQVGEVKYIRMAGEDNLPTRSAFVEFTDQRSVATVLVYNSTMFGGRPIKVCHANSSIVKPVNKNQETAQRELEEAMKKVKEAQSLILAAVEPEIPDKKRSRSRSKSKSHRRHSRSRSKSKPKRRSRSRSRSRPRPSPKRRSRSHSRRRSASRGRRSRSRKRSPHRSRSHSRTRRHRTRSRSPVEVKPKIKIHNEERVRIRSRSRHRSRSRGRKSRSPHRKRSRSRSKRTPPKAYSSRRSRTPPPPPPRNIKRRSRSRSRQKSPVKKKYGTPSPPKLTRECSLPLKDEDKDSSPDRKSSSHEKRSRSRSPGKKMRRSHSHSQIGRGVRRRSPSPVRPRRSRSRSGSRHKSSRTKKKKDQRERSRERSSRDKESKSSKKKHKEARSGAAEKEERIVLSSASASNTSGGSGSKSENTRVTRDYDEEEKGYVSGESKQEKMYGAAAPPSAGATAPGSRTRTITMEDNLESTVPSSMGDQMTSDTNLQQMDMDMSD